MTSPRTHFTTCNLCEAMCGLSITVDGGKVTDIRGDHDDTFSAGHICPKALGLREIYEDPDRLRQPQRRTKNGFVPISWDEALAEVASKRCWAMPAFCARSGPRTALMPTRRMPIRAC